MRRDRDTEVLQDRRETVVRVGIMVCRHDARIGLLFRKLDAPHFHDHSWPRVPFEILIEVHTRQPLVGALARSRPGDSGEELVNWGMGRFLDLEDLPCEVFLSRGVKGICQSQGGLATATVLVLPWRRCGGSVFSPGVVVESPQGSVPGVGI